MISVVLIFTNHTDSHLSFSKIHKIISSIFLKLLILKLQEIKTTVSMTIENIYFNFI